MILVDGLRPLCFGLVILTLSLSAMADYDRTYGKIDYIYLYDNATNSFGVRIVLKDPVTTGYKCSEWYLKLSSNLSDQMYALVLAAEAQEKEITLMLRNTSENLPDSTVCAVHRIYTKKQTS
jgi:hypothetical protein